MKNTTKVLKWRLGKLPTPEEAMSLVKNDIISKEEARDILFNIETLEESTDKESLKAEVVFLRELVTNLASQNTIAGKVIFLEKRYSTQPWFQPYSAWCSFYVPSGSGIQSSIGNSTYTIKLTGTGGTTSNGFSSIKTF